MELVATAAFGLEAVVAREVNFRVQALAALREERPYGCLICNPPYGRRLGDRAAAQKLYREMGRILRTWDTWSFFILTAHRDFQRLFGRRADKRRKLYNGGIECQYYQYFGPRPPRAVCAPDRDPDGGGTG